jgi:hypothetical protein
LSHLRIHRWLGYLLLGLLLPLVFGIADAQTAPGTTNPETPAHEVIESPTWLEKLSFDRLTVLFSLLAILATAGSYFSYRRAQQFARYRPIYLAPGEQSRVQLGYGRSGNSNSEVFAWVYLGSSATILAIILFALIWIPRSVTIFFLICLIPSAIVFGFLIACLLDGRFSALRPCWDPNENRPMKRLDPETVKSRLNEPQKQVAWELGSIEIEGWYLTENPSAIHLRIYDFPRGPRRYRYCPTCQEYILYVADSRVVKEPTNRSEGTRLITYRCHCCDYQDEERKTIPR